MILRIIEFPDGRRITRLIPFQGSGGAMTTNNRRFLSRKAVRVYGLPIS
jgi:hypothetical protein